MIDLPEVEDVEKDKDTRENDDGSLLEDDTLKEWLTDVCNNVFSSAFHSLSKDNMTYEHTKIFCS